MASVDARCTQCGHNNHGDETANDNFVTYDVDRRDSVNRGGA